jgi:NAD(P)-dependent dehydrogenase (short-subunit alcohol dehydrogenase family)
MGALDRKVAVITGATSGIGASMAALFAAEGADVIIAARRREEGEELAETLGAHFFATDVTVEADIERLVAHALERFGRIDVMVNNAGAAGAPGRITDVDLERFQQTFALHVGGVLAGTKYAARAMLERETAGSIVNVASIGGRLAGWTGLDYSCAKAAVIHLSRCAAVELGEHGIRVNSISPGPILTGIFGKGAGMAPAAADRTASALEPAFLEALEGHQPIRRAGVSEYVAPAALWLASDASSFVTGQDLAVDGGISAGRPASVAKAERAMLARAFAAILPSGTPSS